MLFSLVWNWLQKHPPFFQWPGWGVSFVHQETPANLKLAQKMLIDAPRSLWAVGSSCCELLKVNVQTVLSVQLFFSFCCCTSKVAREKTASSALDAQTSHDAVVGICATVPSPLVPVSSSCWCPRPSLHCFSELLQNIQPLFTAKIENMGAGKWLKSKEGNQSCNTYSIILNKAKIVHHEFAEVLL